MPFPHKSTIKKPKIIKGPKGMGSFLVLIPDTKRKMEITAPRINEKKIVKRIPLTPSTKPMAPIRVTSPPPMPPFETMTISRKIPLP